MTATHRLIRQSGYYIRYIAHCLWRISFRGCLMFAMAKRILRVLGSRTLVCGCLIGLYETYEGRTIALVDARGSSCYERAHWVDAIVANEIPAQAAGKLTAKSDVLS